MGLLTAAIVVGAAGMAYQAVDARKQRKGAEREMKRNDTAAREAMALDETREDSGADIELGTGTDDKRGSTARRRRKRSGDADPVVGGLGASLFGLGGLGR